MKILHSADWHLGKILHDHSLLDDQQYILEQILRIGGDGTYDALIIAGDIYDRSIAPADAMNLMSRFLRDFRKKCETPVMIIAGNHDSRSRLTYLSELLEDKNMHIRGGEDLVATPVRTAEADFWLIPFLDPEIANPGDDNFNSHERPLARAIDQIRTVMDPRRLNIAAAHCFTAGGLSSESERSFVGGSAQVSADLFQIFDYTALGHLHRPQTAGSAIAYAGSPMKYSFSEADDEKVLRSIDLDKNSIEITNIALKPRRDLRRISGNLQSLLEDQSFSRYEDDYLEIELDYIPPGLNPLEHLRERFPWLLSIRRSSAPLQSGGANEQAVRGDMQQRGKDIESDFESFYAYLHPDAPAVPAKQRELFQQERKSAQTQGENE